MLLTVVHNSVERECEKRGRNEKEEQINGEKQAKSLNAKYLNLKTLYHATYKSFYLK